MVEIFEENILSEKRMSSKGNQLKACVEGVWHKTDFTGYEGLAEYIISQLLKKSSLKREEFVLYQTEEIGYKKRKYLGCRSDNFLPEGWQLITLERLFYSHYNESLYKNVYFIKGNVERLRYIVDCISRLTGLQEFGVYMSKLMTIDALFLNEDRHMHNIAVLQDEIGKYHYCPIFDNGAGLLADIMLDYPLEGDTREFMEEVSAKTFCSDFDKQLDVAEELYGQHIKFSFTLKDVKKLLDLEAFYSEETKKRIFEILSEQYKKYRYLFC